MAMPRHLANASRFPTQVSGFTGFTDGQTSIGGIQSFVTWGRANEAQFTVGSDYRYLSQRINEFDRLFQIPCDLNYPVPRTEQNSAGLFFEILTYSVIDSR